MEAKAKATEPSTNPQVGEPKGLLAEAMGDTPKEMTEDLEPFHDVIFLVDVEDSNAPSWAKALESEQCDKWLEGVKVELNGLCKMSVYELISRREVPSNRSVLHGKFVCCLKHDEVGNLVHYKVQWVAKGFQQVWGRDFSKTTSPTAQLELRHIDLHITVVNDWCLEQYNMKTAFLNGILPEEEIQYMEQPPGFIQPDKESHVW
jgi:hypothetical protein